MRQVLKQDVTVNFRNYGEITVPKGTPITHNTAVGYSDEYHFVNDLNWIDTKYPEISGLLRHDAFYYGIDIPAEFIETV